MGELCDDAGALSEECFMKHRLLREGCSCSCPSDSTNSCSDCDKCRRWWKPLLEGELSQSVTSGYEGPRLEGQGNLVPYEYTMQYTIPAGVKSSQAVLRWHYMTTNSCTSKSSAPEEFWNCADIAVVDGNGDRGPDVSFNNAALVSMTPENLIPAINSGVITGVYAACPEAPTGELLGVGPAEEYEGLCEDEDGESLGNCEDMTGGNSGLPSVCNSVPASGIICESECGDWWYQCAHGVPMMKPVPAGVKCKDSDFVVQAACTPLPTSALTTSEPVEEEEEEASTSLPASLPSTTSTPVPAPTPVTTSSPSPSPSSLATSPAPTPTPTTPASECGSCTACLANNGVCYSQTQAFCDLYPLYTWCGESGHVNLRQSAARKVVLNKHFLQRERTSF